MTKYGSAFSNADDLKRAPGTTVDAAIRRHRNVFDLAVDGGTSEALKIAHLREGVVIEGIKMHTGANLSAINFSAGNATAAAKYAAAQAGPNAVTKELQLTVTSLDDDPLTAPEEVLLTPSGNLPGAGTLVVDVFVSKR